MTTDFSMGATSMALQYLLSLLQACATVLGCASSAARTRQARLDRMINITSK